MQRISRAPVLSATLRRVSCWITGCPPTSAGPLHDLGETPVLGLRERTRLDDAHGVPDRGGVALVVGVELARAADDLLVLRVRLRHRDLHDDRLVALVRDDDAAALLAPAELGLLFRETGDRLAARRLLACRLGVLVAQRTRETL